MEQQTNGNDFAFNTSATIIRQTRPEGITASNPPLTKREYFASVALQGILSSRELQITLNKYRIKWAAFSIEMADELIEELNK